MITLSLIAITTIVTMGLFLAIEAVLDEKIPSRKRKKNIKKLERMMEDD